MCNDPPDVVFYTNIVEPPPSVRSESNANLKDTTGDTSALLSAATDTSYLCRARIMFSPSRGLLKVSTHYGPSIKDRQDPELETFKATSIKRGQANQSFRSRRIVDLSSSSSHSMLHQLRGLYNQQKTTLLQGAPESCIQLGNGCTRPPPSRFPQEMWQLCEVQSLGRFLKLTDIWATAEDRDEKGL